AFLQPRVSRVCGASRPPQAGAALSARRVRAGRGDHARDDRGGVPVRRGRRAAPPRRSVLSSRPAMTSWAEARVRITAGRALIRSTRARRLVAEGARVTLCDAMIEGYGGNPANIREIQDRVAVDTSDVRDTSAMERLVRGQDVIFHLAAQVSHVMSLSNPY